MSKHSHSPYPLPLLWLEATGWLAGCWASLGCTEGSGWLGARKGTKECQGNTATERGSTFVHTVGRSHVSWMPGELGPNLHHNLISSSNCVKWLHPVFIPYAPGVSKVRYHWGEKEKSLKGL